MTWSWIDATQKLGLDLADWPAVRAWHEAVGARPAVKRGMEVPRSNEAAEKA